VLVGIEGKLVAASAGSFDDDLKEVVLLVEWLELNGVGERVSLWQFGAPEVLRDDESALFSEREGKAVTLLVRRGAGSFPCRWDDGNEAHSVFRETECASDTLEIVEEFEA
jgi:hypothetical protein